MSKKGRASILLLFIICILTQSVFADVVVGPKPGEVRMLSNMLLVAAAILATWAVCFAVIKAARKKNVDK